MYIHDPRFEYTRNDYLADQVDEFCEHAKFYGKYAQDPIRFAALTSSVRYEDAINLEDWQFECELYPKGALVAEKITAYDNADVPVRAYILKKALKRLLEVVEAPEAMLSDLMLLLSDFEPSGAEKYAKAQRTLIENPESSITDISKLSGLDRSTIHSLLKRGALIRPD